jgi:hypothetical protein
VRIARLHEYAGQKRQAEKQYLRTRRLCYVQRAKSERDQYREEVKRHPALVRGIRQVEAQALSSLSRLYDPSNREELPEILRLMQERRTDSELVAALSLRLAQAEERKREAYDELVLHLTSEQELGL